MLELSYARKKNRHLRPLTEVPSLVYQTMIEFQQPQTQVTDNDQLRNPAMSKSSTLSNAYDVGNNAVTQQAQAMSLLDQVLKATISVGEDERKRLLEVTELDNKIHTARDSSELEDNRYTVHHNCSHSPVITLDIQAYTIAD